MGITQEKEQLAHSMNDMIPKVKEKSSGAARNFDLLKNLFEKSSKCHHYVNQKICVMAPDCGDVCRQKMPFGLGVF